MPHKTQTDWFL